MAINVGTAIAFLELDMSSFKNSLSSAGADLKNFANSGDIQNLTSAMTGIGSDMTKGITLPIAGAGAAMVKVAGDYEEQLSKIKAVSGATSEQMKEMDDLALKMGKETSFSAKEAAQGIEELTKAGLSNEQILNGGLKGALSLASAGELELADAASIASDALNTFKADGLSVQQSADILAGAANASSTDVAELKYGMSAAGSVAAGMGMNFKDTATALAVFANNGLKGSDAGTSLKTMLMNLQPSTDAQYSTFERLGLMTYDTTKAYEYLVKQGIQPASTSFEDVDKAMKKHAAEQAGVKEGTAKANKAYREMTSELGVLHSKFYDEKGNMKSLAEISDLLQNSTKDLTNAQRAQALETMFGSDAIRGANILFKEGANGVNEMQSAMSKVTSDEVAATKLDNFKGSLEQFKGSIETLAIVLGKLLLPHLKELVDWMTGIANKFLELPEPVQKTILSILGITAAIGPMLIMISKVIGSVGSIVGAFGSIGNAVTGVVKVFGSLPSIASAISALPGLIASPVGAVVAIIMAIAAVVYIIYQNWDSLKEYFGGFWEWMKSIFSAFWEWLKSFFTQWGPTILAIIAPFLGIPLLIWQHWDKVKEWLQPIFDWLISAFDAVVSFFSNGIKGLIQAFDDFTSWAGDIGKNICEGIVNGLEAGWDWVFEKVGWMADKIKSLFTESLDIHSPSRVFRGYGVNTMEGYALGIEDHESTITDKMKNFAINVKSLGNIRPDFNFNSLALSGAYNGSSSVLNNTQKHYTFSPKINMQISIADTRAKGTTQLTNELNSMAQTAVKNSMVEQFMDDALRL